MMAMRRSTFTGEMVKVPDPTPAAPDLSAQVADLRVQLATAQTEKAAAIEKCAELAVQLTEAARRNAELASDVATANARIQEMARIVASKPAELPKMPEHQPPVGYTATVTKRDVDGKIERVALQPMEDA